MWALTLPQPMGGGMETLAEIRDSTGESRTVGLGDGVVRDFLESDPSLSRAIEEASDNFQSLKGDLGGKLFEMAETDLVSELQSDYVNFYKAPTVNPYVAIAARGPWIITSHGAVPVSYTHLTLPTKRIV